MTSYCLLASMVSDVDAAINLIEDLFFMPESFVSLIFNNQLIFLDENVLEFILLGIH